MLLNNRFRNACDKNIRSLKTVVHLLAEQNRLVLNQFAMARKGPLISRLMGLKKCGLYRQTWHGNICLLVGAVLKKL
jgi:hypothetical protein